MLELDLLCFHRNSLFPRRVKVGEFRYFFDSKAKSTIQRYDILNQLKIYLKDGCKLKKIENLSFN
jgi:hypothetical protein